MLQRAADRAFVAWGHFRNTIHVARDMRLLALADLANVATVTVFEMIRVIVSGEKGTR